MRSIFALVLILCSAAAFAQSSPPPTVGGKPLVQVKPRGEKSKEAAAPKDAAAPKEAAAPKDAAKAKPGKPQSVAHKLQACLEIEDGSKGRLDCYDAIFPPKPNPKAPKAKGVADCRFTKEEDERLTCFNGFAESVPRF
jgi:hypothetical protein